MKPTQVFVIVEVRDGEPLILNYHARQDCPRLEVEATDPRTDLFRDTVWHPDRLGEILRGEFRPDRGVKSRATLSATKVENEFLDADGQLHIIAPCQICVLGVRDD